VEAEVKENVFSRLTVVKLTGERIDSKGEFQAQDTTRKSTFALVNSI